jgi:hypothetical protein
MTTSGLKSRMGPSGRLYKRLATKTAMFRHVPGHFLRMTASLTTDNFNPSIRSQVSKLLCAVSFAADG